MKVNNLIVHQDPSKCKWHVCPNCGSDRYYEHFADPESSDPKDQYHWSCLDCQYTDYDYIIF